MNHEDLIPANLKPSLTSGDRLKPALTTGEYTGGVPESAAQVKPSLLMSDGTLKPSLMLDGALKPGIAKPHAPSNNPVVSMEYGSLIFPGKAINSAQSGQWYANDVVIIGQTGSSYTIRISDIGKTIRCGESNGLTVWHPHDIAAVASVRYAADPENVLNASDEPATDSEAVANWKSVGGVNASQEIGTRRPVFDLDAYGAGRPAIVFDGDNDSLVWQSQLDVFRNRTIAGALVACTDTNPTGGNNAHYLVFASNGANSGQARLSLATRDSSQSRYSSIHRRLDADGAANLTSGISNGAAIVLAAQTDYTAGAKAIFLDGTTIASQSVATGVTSDTDSLSISTGGAGVVGFLGLIAAEITWNAALTEQDRNRLTQWAALTQGRDLELEIE